MSSHHATLHYIHDPLCGWCYAAQPLVSAAMRQLGARVDLILHAGGLFAEPRTLDHELGEHIAHSDERIAQLSGQFFGKPYLEGLLADPTTVLFSLPPITAILAARSIDASLAYPMLVAIQAAHYQRGLRVVDPDILVEMAEELAIDGDTFRQSYARVRSTDLLEHIEASRRLLNEVHGHGFPTLVLEVHGKRQVLPHHLDYGKPEAFVERLAARLPAVH
ncbi:MULTISPECIES: DsbA family protein [Dyella]|uniref:DsbA family protein n=2 Tax=Dyella TaxID=231454 RepID=A0A4R0Z0B4_9GAMM|nr:MULTISPECIES: DsbA family protein [Dyella]TBR39630.1 DsbA family protein [Dyella terrae]TCI12788.1 DsbA family protein [Dyella soli]